MLIPLINKNIVEVQCKIIKQPLYYTDLSFPDINTFWKVAILKDRYFEKCTLWKVAILQPLRA